MGEHLCGGGLVCGDEVGEIRLLGRGEGVVEIRFVFGRGAVYEVGEMRLLGRGCWEGVRCMRLGWMDGWLGGCGDVGKSGGFLGLGLGLLGGEA